METAVTNLVYRIEPNPAGGFIARASDPSLQPIEGATREEVQQKIQAKITEMVQSQLPMVLKLGGLTVKINSKVNITTRNTSTPGVISQTLPQNSPAQNIPDFAATPSDRISTMLRVAAGVLALLAILYFLLRR